jgi:general transcription factor 3C polypeptide 3 (transcription factor C subunit 4)
MPCNSLTHKTACAILASDEETCIAVARYFLRENPYSSDPYRMFATLSRLVQSPSSWYHSGPAQKFMLRQIRAMDETLQKQQQQQQQQRKKAKKTKRQSTRHDEPEGEEVTKAGFKQLDVVLLTLYGHILLSSASFPPALNYFHRVVSIDPTNALASLSVGVAYTHWALTRKAGNRQAMLAQGLAFLWRYYDLRRALPQEEGSDTVEREGEAEFNMARSYHMLGLLALAADGYRKVLALAEGRGVGGDGRDVNAVGGGGVAVEAAYNLRTLYLMGGDHVAAGEVTRRWLVLG